jgi:calmodulin
MTFSLSPAPPSPTGQEGHGFISAAELKHVMTNLAKLGEDDVDDMLATADPHNTGQVNYEDFVRLVMA